MSANERWANMAGFQKVLLVVATVVQVGLLAVAQRDLARRPAALVRGPKPLWGAINMVNFVGPLAYLTFGRRSTAG